MDRGAPRAALIPSARRALERAVRDGVYGPGDIRPLDPPHDCPAPPAILDADGAFWIYVWRMARICRLVCRESVRGYTGVCDLAHVAAGRHRQEVSRPNTCTEGGGLMAVFNPPLLPHRYSTSSQPTRISCY